MFHNKAQKRGVLSGKALRRPFGQFDIPDELPPDGLHSGLRRSVTIVHGRHKIMKGAVMAVVTESGTVRSGDTIHIVEPEASMHRSLRPI
jgi:hypothetical protein